jgi:hypothetical protein
MNEKRNSLMWILVINLIISILLSSVGQEIIISEFISYYFWLSLGLYLGFQLCKYECKKLLKKHSGN